MNLSFILAAAAAEGAKEPNILETFGWNAWGFLSQVISFSIVAFLLAKFAYNPILNVLEERRRKIAEGLENAAKIQTQLAETQKSTAEIIAKAHVEAAALVEQARAAAKQVSERENQRAVAQAGEIIQKAREAGEAEQKRLMAELKKDLSRLVVDTTAKVTGKVLTSADQKKITDEATREIAA